jgi:hypothetical protein
MTQNISSVAQKVFSMMELINSMTEKSKSLPKKGTFKPNLAGTAEGLKIADCNVIHF